MKALILAAGRGTRVRPLTDRMPKPMIPIIHKPVMAFLVEHLRRYGVQQIMVNTSYLSPLIEAYFRDGAHFGVEMAYSFEGRLEQGRLVDAPLGSAGAIRKIQQHSAFFDETFIVLCGDAVIDLDLGELLAFHRSHGGPATAALRQVAPEEVCNYGVALLTPDGRISRFQEKPRPDEALSQTINTGIYIFEPSVLRHIPASGPYDIGSQLFPLLAARGLLHGCATQRAWQWLDIGRIPDFHHVNMLAMQGAVDGFQLPGRQVRPGVWLGVNARLNLARCDVRGPVYIGGSAEVCDGATLAGPLVIGAGSVIGPRAHLEQTVVLEHTRVSAGAFCQRKIVGGDFCVDVDGTVLDGSHTDTSWLFADARGEAAALNPEQAELRAVAMALAG